MRHANSKINQFEQIKSAASLDWIDCITWFIQFVCGSLIIPTFLKVGIVFGEELANYLLVEKGNRLPFQIMRSIFVLLQKGQWILLCAIIVIYWFRTNVKMYNYSFSRYVSSSIHSQLDNSFIRCPRCGQMMSRNTFVETENVKVGTTTKMHYEYEDSGPYAQKKWIGEEIPVYGTESHLRRYAVCENSKCCFQSKKPHGFDVAFYKFYEMPYRLSDTVEYAVNTRSDAKENSGNISSYRREFPLRLYLFLIFIAAIGCDYDDFCCAIFVLEKDLFLRFIETLFVPFGCLLLISAVIQTVIHLRYRKKYRKKGKREKSRSTNRSDDVAITAQEIQRMYDEIRLTRERQENKD